MSSTNQLAPPRLVVTTHDAAGTSIFASDQQITQFAPFGPKGSSFARFHSRLAVPVSNTALPPAELANVLPRCPPSGVLFCTTDIPPGTTVPTHRTLTQDYIAVMQGEIVLTLDGGEEKTVRAGEFIVQRGSNHGWINRSEEVCRLMCVLVASEQIVLADGKVLEGTAFKK
ncbi:hypothetical protein AOQ84DRAFT_356994 [Glonium stellatum]|uniref:Cupin type-2 domain-containing protein n=1 Tax=Glonium stellatum TaxID=574774 RepID=A0A8E2JN23_9PEZI|nr:hypothetical protein AOQ84DRAFT_356994 [Glonium stellatum]